jgi:membrane protein YqaA with SNARE-associated domain
MNKVESYSLLFTDSLISNLAINPSSEFVIYSMKAFANYDNTLIFVIAVAASFISITLNYFFGKVLKNILNISPSTSVNTKQKTAAAFFNKYYIFFLALSVIPVCGKFVQVIAGVFDVKYSRVISICMFLKTIYYLVILFIQ